MNFQNPNARVAILRHFEEIPNIFEKNIDSNRLSGLPEVGLAQSAIAEESKF